MDMHTACEEAYKNGYAKAEEEMKKTVATERERADGLQGEVFKLHIKLDALMAERVTLRDKLRTQEKMIDRLQGREEAFERLLGIVYEAIGADARQRLYRILFREADADGSKERQ